MEKRGVFWREGRKKIVLSRANGVSGAEEKH